MLGLAHETNGRSVQAPLPKWANPLYGGALFLAAHRWRMADFQISAQSFPMPNS